jgi:hypothetical protein
VGSRTLIAMTPRDPGGLRRARMKLSARTKECGSYESMDQLGSQNGVTPVSTA